MGGNVNAPICTPVTTDEFHKAKGFEVGVIRHKGKTLVFCTESGGVVGDSITQVMIDIKTGKPSVMREQIAQAKIDGRKAVSVTIDEFFG